MPQVDDLKILGVTFSTNLKWNSLLEDVIRKASQRMYIVCNLKRSACPSKLISTAYVAFIRSVLLYAFPCFCNISLYLRNRMSCVEKRVFRIIGDECKEGLLFEVADDLQ